MNVEHWDPQRQGPLSEDSVRQELEARGYRVARYVYEPGTVFREHTHPVDKIDAVLSGRFRMTTPEGEVTLEAGDLLTLPRGLVHRAEVVGNEPVVSLDASRG